jgi:hypothetical protein
MEKKRTRAFAHQTQAVNDTRRHCENSGRAVRIVKSPVVLPRAKGNMGAPEGPMIWIALLMMGCNGDPDPKVGGTPDTGGVMHTPVTPTVQV